MEDSGLLDRRRSSWQENELRINSRLRPLMNCSLLRLLPPLPSHRLSIACGAYMKYTIFWRSGTENTDSLTRSLARSLTGTSRLCSSLLRFSGDLPNEISSKIGCIERCPLQCFEGRGKLRRPRCSQIVAHTSPAWATPYHALRNDERASERASDRRNAIRGDPKRSTSKRDGPGRPTTNHRLAE